MRQFQARTCDAVDEMAKALSVPQRTAPRCGEPLGDDFWSEFQAMATSNEESIHSVLHPTAERSRISISTRGSDLSCIMKLQEIEQDANKRRVGQLPPSAGGALFSFVPRSLAPLPAAARVFDFRGKRGSFTSDVMSLKLVPFDECTEQNLHDLFSGFGPIAQVAIGHPSPQHDCRDAEITFFQEEAALAAVSQCASAFGHNLVTAGLGTPSSCTDQMKVRRMYLLPASVVCITIGDGVRL